jgi:siroheme synthase-like protein
MRPYYPLLLDLTDRRALIVGAGVVAARKAKVLLEAGATHVTVVAPHFSDEVPEAVRKVQREFAPSDLDGIDLCFAATDNPDVNDQVVRLCRERHILVNRADRDEELPGDFTVPAIHRDGPLTVAVAASGSPRLAAAVRDSIAESLDPAWATMGEVALAIRRRVVTDPAMSMARRKAILQALSSKPSLEAYKAGGTTALHSLLEEQFPELKGSR